MTLTQSLWRQGVKTGVIGGVALLVLTLVGMVEAFSKRDIVTEVISLGISFIVLTGLIIPYIAAKKTERPEKSIQFANAVIAALVMSLFLAFLVIIGRNINLREVLVNASPVLYSLLTGGVEGAGGILVILAAGLVCGLFAGALYFMPQLVRSVIITCLVSVLAMGTLQDLVRPILTRWGTVIKFFDTFAEWLFTQNGLTIPGTIFVVIVVGGIFIFWKLKKESVQTKYQSFSGDTQKTLKYTSFGLLGALLLVLPWLLGLFPSEVLTIVGLYILLGLGLNIVVGYAGLLDLGYVAFFAIGSYTTAILTSPELGFFSLTFWQALPFAIICGIFAGVLLGIPVLKMRGDYLAIATLGFGEIIRILVLSDFLRPWLGGAQGAGKIPNPVIFGWQLTTPMEIYYLILGGCILVVFISLRLRDSRLGRAWMAMREDEDVAQAMGINLVATKLLAFATGAGFSALSGAIFVGKIGSVYPHSFNVMISINIICLIIVGGIGSIPGVIVGAAALVGLPELLREFAEYRLLVYGAVLVGMMLIRPEGLWPEARHKMELHADENGEPETQAAPAT